MALFCAQFVGGPACGALCKSPQAPRSGETHIWTDGKGSHHIYAFRCAGYLPPAWRYVGVLSNKEARNK
jgi:hypothetical protein